MKRLMKKKKNEPVKKIYVCSPYGGLEDNLLIASFICDKLVKMGYIPFAAHLMFPNFLDDSVKEERQFGLLAALEFMPACDEVWLFVHAGKSNGMIKEEERARILKKPVKFVDWEHMIG